MALITDDNDNLVPVGTTSVKPKRTIGQMFINFIYEQCHIATIDFVPISILGFNVTCAEGVGFRETDPKQGGCRYILLREGYLIELINLLDGGYTQSPMVDLLEVTVEEGTSNKYRDIWASYCSEFKRQRDLLRTK